MWRAVLYIIPLCRYIYIYIYIYICIYQADLIGARLSRANLLNARLDGANLETAVLDSDAYRRHIERRAG